MALSESGRFVPMSRPAVLCKFPVRKRDSGGFSDVEVRNYNISRCRHQILLFKQLKQS